MSAIASPFLAGRKGRSASIVAKAWTAKAKAKGNLDWRGYGAQGERWFGFDAVRELHGLAPEILMVPLRGHTWSMRAWRSGTMMGAGSSMPTPILSGRDAAGAAFCTLGLRACQRLMEIDARSRMTNQERLRAFSIERRDEVTVTCSHDLVELERCQEGRPL